MSTSQPFALRRGFAVLAVCGLIAVGCSSGDSALTAGNDEPAEQTAADTTDADASEAPDPDVDDDTGSTAPPSTEAPPTTAPVTDLADCATDVLDAADGPVEITYWHGMTGENETAIEFLAGEYNASQDRVVLSIENQGGYLEVIDKYYQSGADSRPDVVMFPEYGLQQAVDSGTVIPAQSCIDSSGFDVSPVLPSAMAAYATQGAQWGMPFNVSNPILYYNKQAFIAAGLDPDQPPTTFDELRSVSEALVDSGAAGFGLAFDSNIDSGGGWFIEQWFANAGVEYVNNGNGRAAAATEVTFDGEFGSELFSFLKGMHDDGLLVYVGDNASGQDTFLKVADRQAPAAMVIGTSAGLGTVLAVLGSGVIEGVVGDDIGVAALPGAPDGSGMAVGGAANFVANNGDELAEAAAWDFITFLLDPAMQSEWAARTGYVPIVDAALDLDPIKSTYDSDPRFRVAFDQLAANDGSRAAAGPLIGPHRQVRVATADAIASIFGGADVDDAISGAATVANQLLADYLALNG